MAGQDYGNCEDCGKPLNKDEDFRWRADMINEALDGADDMTAEQLLAMFAGRHISRFVAEDHKKVRRGLIREIDVQTKYWVISGCDA